MIPKSEDSIKAYRVKQARLDLNGTHCLTLSPFIVAASPAELMERLEDFSSEVQGAVASLYGIVGQLSPAEPDRSESVKAVVETLSRAVETENLDGGLNKIFLQSVDRVQTSMRTLEQEIIDSKTVPADTLDVALNSLHKLGLFVEAVPQIYQRTM